MQSAVGKQPGIRNGLTFISGLIETTNSEPDNVLILVPNQFANPNDLQQMGDPAWYDSEAKKNIIFFYAGSVPFRPVGNLHEAVTKPRPWGTFVRLQTYNIPGQAF